MPIDPHATAFFTQLRSVLLPSPEQLSAAKLRKLLQHVIAMQPPLPTHVQKEDRVVSRPHGGKLGVRIYTPSVFHLHSSAHAPALVYYHGGGFVAGNLDMYDFVCGSLADLVPCKVISVNYRLAPEFPFPAAVQDAGDTYVWIIKQASALHLDPQRIAIGGDSSGGNLATVTALRAASIGVDRPCLQILAYPITDATMSCPSHREPPEPVLFTTMHGRWFREQYFRNVADAPHRWASPLLSSDLHLSPPTYIITAEHDILRDEGIAYATALRKEKILVEHVHYNKALHGFLNMARFTPLATQALKGMARALQRAFFHQPIRSARSYVGNIEGL